MVDWVEGFHQSLIVFLIRNDSYHNIISIVTNFVRLTGSEVLRLS